MNHAPMFSILVPVYNANNYLLECLQSIESQSYSDYEVILVDDGSTDGSGEICDEWALRNGCCRVVHTPNRGLFLSRRTGFEFAEGQYCIPLDADDALRPDALRVIFDAAKKLHPDIIAFSISRTKDFEGGKNGIPFGYHHGQCNGLRKAACSGYANNLCGKAFRRTVVQEAMGDFVPLQNASFAEDWAQLLSIVERASSCYSIDECLYWYRPNETSTIHVFNSSHIAGLDRAFRELRFFSEKWGDSCKEIANTSMIDHAFGLLTILLSSDESIELSNADGFRRALDRWDVESLKPKGIVGKLKKSVLVLYLHRHVFVPRVSVAARSALLGLLRVER